MKPTKRVITNETTRTKAVRVKGGHKTLKPGDQVTLEVEWDKVEAKKYRDAGLLVQTEAEAKQAADDAAKEAKQATKDDKGGKP